MSNWLNKATTTRVSVLPDPKDEKTVKDSETVSAINETVKAIVYPEKKGEKREDPIRIILLSYERKSQDMLVNMEL